MPISNRLGLLIVLLLLVSPSLQTLKFYHAPQNPMRQYSKGMEYKLANFGHYSYNREMIGEIRVSEPLNACTLNQQQNQNTNNTLESSSSNSSSHSPLFLIAKRGDCTFVEKAKIAQLMGARLLIIQNDRNGYLSEMGDDGQAYYSVDIPVILISKWDGEQIRKTFSRNSNESVVMNIQFELK